MPDWAGSPIYWLAFAAVMALGAIGSAALGGWIVTKTSGWGQLGKAVLLASLWLIVLGLLLRLWVTR